LQTAAQFRQCRRRALLDKSLQAGRTENGSRAVPERAGGRLPRGTPAPKDFLHPTETHAKPFGQLGLSAVTGFPGIPTSFCRKSSEYCIKLPSFVSLPHPYTNVKFALVLQLYLVQPARARC
jgi:hypothetical protein